MIRDFLNLIFPEVCLNCNTPTVRGEDILCTRCMADLPRDVTGETALVQKFVATPGIKFAYSFLKFSKSGIAQRLIHQLKYERSPEIGTLLGIWFGAAIKDKISTWEPKLIVPVPLHKSRLRTRGYNQSDSIAEGLSKALNIRWQNDIAIRTKQTGTQTNKGKADRWQNVGNIFQVMNPNAIAGKKLLAVDDVITTGATIDTFADALLTAGAKEIGILSLARAE